ncbi:MAG TPA: bi-domain-containing oxidoreductase [Blastocatellia bacterium]|jgi:predicted dehydrogenase/threonine dehydrogenase-like Zn-dependent dehydrogenase|nr:bi-domain-containing oxidoreductase [Blastocatellia bacterium]
MKQVVQNFRTGELKVEDLPPPLLRPGGVLVDTAYSLISAGTERTIVETAQNSLIGKARGRPDLVRQMFDTLKREGLRSTYAKVKARLDQIKPLGYSASGIVVAVGEAVRGLQVGDRVACAGGGYASHAEVLFVPQNLCCKVPEGTPLESACYATVGSIALHGIRQAEVRLGETIAVIGLGLVGQLTVQLLKAAGCRVLGIDIDPAACELATRSGADMTGDTQSAVEACSAFTDGRGADCIIVTAGTKSNEPIELAGQLARDRARVVVVGMVGMDVPRHVYYEKELELRLSRSYGPGRYDPQYEEKGNDYPIGYVRWTEKRNMEAFLHLAAEGKIRIELLTTHRFSVERATEAYELITGKGGERYCGVVLEYPAARKVRAEPVKLILAKSLGKDDMGVGFIGAGAFARGVLLPIARRSAKVQLLGVAAATGVSAKNTAEQFGFSYATTEYGRILGDERTACVFVATRHDSHARLAAEGLSSGKAVFVEKPLALTEGELSEVTAAALKSGSLLMVGFNRRFAPLAQEVKKRFAHRSGPMTIVYRVNAGQLQKDHWSLDATEGGGRIIGEVCHFIDFVQWVTDALPVRVSAESVSETERTGFVDDSVAVAMRMADGSVASIVYTASGDKSVGKEQIEIFCGGSVALIDDFKSGHFTREGKRVKLGGGSQDKGHSAEVQAFFEAVRGRTPPPISLESLVATSLTCFAVVRCAKGGEAASIETGPLMA